MATTEALLTADEYAGLPDQGRPTELVRGKIIMMNMPGARHGWICSRLSYYLWEFVGQQGLGHVLSNDSGIVTTRDPDTVRGADVCFYSYGRMPKGSVPTRYAAVAPDLVFEVLSPDDRWKDVLAKVVEYLGAGVVSVCIIDGQEPAAHIDRADRAAKTIHAAEALEFPDVLPGFALPLARLFDN